MQEARILQVLIIDDSDITRSLLKMILRSARFDIVGEALDGPSGLDMAFALRPDLILLDHHMPGKNGVDLLREIHAKLPKTMILMVTANNEMEQVKKAMSLGASGYIVKPFNSISVLETMETARQKFVLSGPADIL
jgi:two-component system, chemotaxis family, chemotaxis protein CheY